MSNDIPTRSRTLVMSREERRCLRCGGPGGEWHHRRGRRVKDDHTHCPCNGVYLCKRCHDQVHSKPVLAMVDGFIVRRHVTEPFSEPVLPWWSRGTGKKIWLRCNSDTWSYVEEEQDG